MRACLYFLNFLNSLFLYLLASKQDLVNWNGNQVRLTMLQRVCITFSDNAAAMDRNVLPCLATNIFFWIKNPTNIWQIVLIRLYFICYIKVSNCAYNVSIKSQGFTLYSTIVFNWHSCCLCGETIQIIWNPIKSSILAHIHSKLGVSSVVLMVHRGRGRQKKAKECLSMTNKRTPGCFENFESKTNQLCYCSAWILKCRDFVDKGFFYLQETSIFGNYSFFPIQSMISKLYYLLLETSSMVRRFSASLKFEINHSTKSKLYICWEKCGWNINFSRFSSTCFLLIN